MKKATEVVLYWLYQNFARNLPWGNTLGMNTLTAIGTGLAQPCHCTWPDCAAGDALARHLLTYGYRDTFAAGFDEQFNPRDRFRPKARKAIFKKTHGQK